MANYKPKECAICGNLFTPTSSRSKYCSNKCNQEARREANRTYRARHAEKCRQLDREWYQKNRETRLAKMRHEYHSHIEFYRKRGREKYQANAEKYAALGRKWRRENYSKFKESHNKWRANNPDKAGSVAARRAQAELDGNATPELIKAKWEAGDKTCLLCGDTIDPTLKAPHRMSLTIEHLTPIARGGTHDLDNIDFAHFSCNASKGTKTLKEWQEQYRQ